MISRSIIFWLALFFLYATTALLSAYTGLFGSWTQSSFGVARYYNWDPDAFYLASGIEFFDSRYPTFIGHPGLPLQFIIGTLSHGLYKVWPGQYDSSYFDFVAEHQYALILSARLAIAACHFVSVVVLYKISRIFLSAGQSQVAISIYATTAISLTYITKISPEPLLVAFVMLAYWFSIRSAVSIEIKHGVIYSALTAFFTVLALLSKLMIAAALPFYFLIVITISNTIDRRCKTIVLMAYTVFTIVLFRLLSEKVNWGEYFSYWAGYSPLPPSHSASGISQVANIFQVGASFVSLAAGLVIQHLDLVNVFNIRTWQGQFNIAELPLVLLGLGGMVRYWDNYPEKRLVLKQLFILLLLLTPVVVLKNASHYRVIHLAFFSIFSAYMLFASARYLEKFLIKKGWGRAFKIQLIAGVLGLNIFGVALAVEAKIQDFHAYSAGWKQIYDCLRIINAGERISLEDGGASGIRPDRLLDYYLSDPRYKVSMLRHYEPETIVLSKDNKSDQGNSGKTHCVAEISGLKFLK